MPEDELRKLFAVARDENRLLYYNELVERARTQAGPRAFRERVLPRPWRYEGPLAARRPPRDRNKKCTSVSFLSRRAVSIEEVWVPILLQRSAVQTRTFGTVMA